MRTLRIVLPLLASASTALCLASVDKPKFVGWIVDASCPAIKRKQLSGKVDNLTPSDVQNLRLYAGQSVRATKSGTVNLLLHGHKTPLTPRDGWVLLKENPNSVTKGQSIYPEFVSPAGQEKGKSASPEAIWRRMSLLSLQTPANAKDLRVQLRIKPVDAQGKPKAKVPIVNGLVAIKHGDPVVVEISNDSSIPLYISLVDIDRVANVEILSPQAPATEVLVPAKSKWTRLPSPFYMSVPSGFDSGIEHFKVIASTHRINLSRLATKGMTDQAESVKPISDPLAYLLKACGTEDTLANPGRWTTAQQDFLVQSK